MIADGNGLITVLLGNGDGTFRSGPSTDTVIFGSNGFVVEDLNGDGIPDLVQVGGTYNGLKAGIAVSLGNGDGTFSSGVVYQAGSTIGYQLEGPILGDFNGDGVLDVVAVGNGGVWMFTGQGGGTFNTGVLAVPFQQGTFRVATADFNGDKKLDLVVILNGPGFVVLFGNGNGTFQSPVTFATPGSAFSVAAGSLTKGGPPGIVLSQSNVLYIYYGNGAGKFYGPYTKHTPANGGSIAIGDVNGDGIPDIVSAGVYILFGESGGAFTKPYYYPISGNVGPIGAYGLALADLKKNGQTDIVTGGNYISVLLNLGKGFMEDGIWINDTGGASCGAAADFNRDGKPDLAVDNPNGVSILLGSGKYLAPFKAGTNIALAGAACVVVGDLTASPTCWYPSMEPASPSTLT